MTDQTRPEDFRNIRDGKYAHIKGWGIDADPKNDPTYPMKKRTNEEHYGYSWDRPSLQPETAEVLQSVERPNLTAVYGTTVPPSGLSGMIRRKAFQYSESSYARWLPLVMADRINVYEGIIDDIRHGSFPNIAAERGWNAEWKHNRRTFVSNVATVAVLAGAVTAYFVAKIKNRDHQHELDYSFE
jgi:hypothetical protein